MSKVTAKAGNVFIATYGSLRLRMENFRVNGSGGGVHVGTGRTVDNINLYRYGGAYFPSVSLSHNSNGKQVVVDVFEAPEEGLTGAYDMLEGYPNFYNRTIVPIVQNNGDTLDAWIYHIDEEQEHLVESGDWCTFKRPEYYSEDSE